MNYYGRLDGPTKNDAKKQIIDNVNKQIKNDLKYIKNDLKYINNNNKIIEVVEHIIKSEFQNKKNISTILGWSTFYYNDLTKQSIKKLTKINTELEIKHKKKICAGVITLHQLVNEDILNEIIFKMKYIK